MTGADRCRGGELQLGGRSPVVSRRAVGRRRCGEDRGRRQRIHRSSPVRWCRGSRDDRVELLALEHQHRVRRWLQPRVRRRSRDDCGIVAFVNPDVVVAPDCLRLAAEALTADSGLAGVAPRLMREDGVTVDSVGQVLHPITLEVRDRGYGRALTPELLEPRPVLAACGALAVFRRDALASVAEGEGPWAEEYFCFWEDLELGWRSGQRRLPDLESPGRRGDPRPRRRRRRRPGPAALAATGRARGLRHHQSLDDPHPPPPHP